MASKSSTTALADRLCAAAHAGSIPRVSAAIAAGASVNACGKAPGNGSGYPPLYHAIAGTGNCELVALLLSHGADANGQNVFLAAAEWATSGVLQLLVDVGGTRGSAAGDMSYCVGVKYFLPLVRHRVTLREGCGKRARRCPIPNVLCC